MSWPMAMPAVMTFSIVIAGLVLGIFRAITTPRQP